MDSVYRPTFQVSTIFQRTVFFCVGLYLLRLIYHKGLTEFYGLPQTMTSRGEIGWQSEKSLAECMSYMLDNEIATDVCFEVGPPDGATASIRAHRLLLTARSPVFEAMFSSGMTESKGGKDEKIRIEDISVDVFKALLRFIYTDHVDISPQAAPALMYAAKKYMLPKLSKQCSSLLQTIIDVENVCYLLDQSLLFSEETLRDDCLKFISRFADEIFRREEFLDSSREAMKVILKMGEMRTKESFIFQSCENWAKYQLGCYKSIDDPSDIQIREALGSLLFSIRFPTMDPEEFANLVDDRHVLTAEEKSSIYFYFIKKDQRENLLFDVNKRNVEEKCVDRTINVQSGLWNSGPSRDFIAFTADKGVELCGLGLFTGPYENTAYFVDIEILDPEKSLFRKRFTIPFTGNSTPFKISFDSPICIRSGIIYTIVAFTQSHIGYYSKECQVTCKSDYITFTFSTSDQTSQPGAFCGQIPQLFYV